MTREDMTREEAIAYFKRHIDLYCVDGISREAEEMAIKALEQEPCEDAISREKVYKLLEKEDWADTVYGVKDLPSVQPTRAKGEWINNQNGTFECDKCGCKNSRSNYCPNCGAYMGGEEEE